VYAKGPGKYYVLKNLLHLVLPSWLPRILFLDDDVFLFTDVTRLWQHWQQFRPPQLLGMASEQSPQYSFVTAQGGYGLNSGVVLMDLQAMRESARLRRLLYEYSAPCRSKKNCQVALPLPEEKSLGYVADQTLFSLMSTDAAGGRELFYSLPCGWNRQLSQSYSAATGVAYLRHWSCSAQCNLVHANEREWKPVVRALQQDPTGRTCTQSLDWFRCNLKPFNIWLSFASNAMDMLRECCGRAA
jgi:hypothetical protein